MQLSFFCMNIDEEIYRVLAMVGQRGLTVKKISLHVHNACNNLFESISYGEVYSYVKDFLYRTSMKRQSCIERMGKRGLYRLKDAQDDPQLNFCYGEEGQDEPPQTDGVSVDESYPSLFDEA